MRGLEPKGTALVLAGLPELISVKLENTLESLGATAQKKVPVVLRDDLTATVANQAAQELRALGAEVEVWEPTIVGPPGSSASAASGNDLIRTIRPEPEDTYLILLSAGDKKIQVIKEVRACTNLGLKEAKDLVDEAPSIVGKWTATTASEVQVKMVASGAAVELVGSAQEKSSTLFDVLVLDLNVNVQKPILASFGILLGRTGTPPIVKRPTLMVHAVAQYVAAHLVALIEECGGRAEARPVEGTPVE